VASLVVLVAIAWYLIKKRIKNTNANITSFDKIMDPYLRRRIDFEKILININEYFLNSKIQVNSPCYISYAWYKENEKNIKLQKWLITFKNDLKKVGIDTFLDVENMTGNMNTTMAENIAKSNFVFIVVTPRFKERADDNTSHLQFELNNIVESNKFIIPILIEGDFNTSLPSQFDIKNLFAYDFTSFDYFTLLIGTTNPKGIIPTIFKLNNDDHVYAALVKDFNNIK